jgi:Outer membrane protein beta-barrel domain
MTTKIPDIFWALPAVSVISFFNGDVIMKKTIYIIIILLLIAVSSSQAADYAIDKGAFNIDGSFNYVTYHGDLYGSSADNTHFTIQTVFQWFYVRGLAFGFNALLDINKAGGNNETQFAYGPTVTYYLGNENSKGFPFIRGSASFGKADTEILMYSEGYMGYIVVQQDANVTDLSASAGALYFLSDHLALTGMVTYTNRNYKFDSSFDDRKQDHVGFSLGLGAFIY